MKLVFDINHSGEKAAGISAYSDVVTVDVESGCPGGEKGEFEEYIQDCLTHWYDGALVKHRKPKTDSGATIPGIDLLTLVDKWVDVADELHRNSNTGHIIDRAAMKGVAEQTLRMTNQLRVLIRDN